MSTKEVVENDAIETNEADSETLSPGGDSELEVSGSQTTESTEPDESDEAISDEQDRLNRIWNAEKNCRRKESEVEYAKEQLKVAKAMYEDSVQVLRDLAAQNDEDDRPLFDSPPGGSETASDSESEPVEDWKLESIQVVLAEPIRGLGNKKVEALVDAVPTLGDLEKLRTQVGKDSDHLAGLLPKGIGKETADEIENRALEFAARWEPPTPASESGLDENDGSETKSESEMTDAELSQALKARLLYFARDAKERGVSEWWDAEDAVDEDVWNAGHESGQAGESFDECVYLAGDKQDDWLCGWAAGQVDNEDCFLWNESNDSDSEPETVNAYGDSDSDDLDDL